MSTGLSIIAQPLRLAFPYVHDVELLDELEGLLCELLDDEICEILEDEGKLIEELELLEELEGLLCELLEEL